MKRVRTPSRSYALDLRLYVVIDIGIAGERLPADIAAAAIRGGASFVQVRDKFGSTRRLMSGTSTVMKVAGEARVPVVVNDRADVAHAVGADGVHLGDEDLPIEAARLLLGPNAIIGYSAGNPGEARDAQRLGADYLGTGDVFGTSTKGDADTPIGLDGLRAVVEAVTIPVVAIGGVRPAQAAEAIRAGAAGVAVVSAVVGSEDPEVAARALRREIERALAAGATGARVEIDGSGSVHG
jgi:thiamine-phosphate diphosphorylase